MSLNNLLTELRDEHAIEPEEVAHLVATEDQLELDGSVALARIPDVARTLISWTEAVDVLRRHLPLMRRRPHRPPASSAAKVAAGHVGFLH